MKVAREWAREEAPYIYFIFFAKNMLTTTNVMIAPIIPKNQAKLPSGPPGTGTFIPNKPQMKFKGTKIVAMVVIFPRTSLALLFV